MLGRTSPPPGGQIATYRDTLGLAVDITLVASSDAGVLRGLGGGELDGGRSSRAGDSGDFGALSSGEDGKGAGDEDGGETHLDELSGITELIYFKSSDERVSGSRAGDLV